jgi:hypothetical protein
MYIQHAVVSGLPILRTYPSNPFLADFKDSTNSYGNFSKLLLKIIAGRVRGNSFANVVWRVICLITPRSYQNHKLAFIVLQMIVL